MYLIVHQDSEKDRLSETEDYPSGSTDIMGCYNLEAFPFTIERGAEDIQAETDSFYVWVSPIVRHMGHPISANLLKPIRDYYHEGLQKEERKAIEAAQAIVLGSYQEKKHALTFLLYKAYPIGLKKAAIFAEDALSTIPYKEESEEDRAAAAHHAITGE